MQEEASVLGLPLRLLSELQSMLSESANKGELQSGRMGDASALGQTEGGCVVGGSRRTGSGHEERSEAGGTNRRGRGMQEVIPSKGQSFSLVGTNGQRSMSC